MDDLHDRYGPEARYAVEAEATLPTTKGEQEVSRGLELGLPGADSIVDRRIPTFSRGEYDVAVLGAPFDGGTTYRPGTRFGPQGIRKISARYGPYSFELGVDLRESITIADLGDVFTIPGNIEKTFDQISKAVGHVYSSSADPGEVMIILGVGLGILAVVLIGLSVARKIQGDSTNFLVAGRSLALPLTAAGLMGQAVDTNATLGNTDLTAAGGFWAGASLPIGLAICLVLTGLFFAKRMNSMKLLTIGDFYRRRYGRGVEVAASLMMIFSFCILLAGNLVAGGFLVERFLGTSYAFGVLLIVGVVLLYTATGGMYSDAYTAFAQMVITVVATVALLAWVALTYGITIPEGRGPFELGQLTSAEQGAMVNWAALLALGIGDIVAIDFMQRIFAARSPQVAQQACFVGALGVLAVGVPFSLVALSSGAILGGGPGSGPVLFTLLDNYAPVGLTVLVLSGIVAASCSTANGAILGTAAVAARNVVGVQLEDGTRDSCRLLRATRITLIPVVAIAVLFALRVPQTGILLTLAFDVMLAALAFPFIFGHYWSRASTAAAVAAITVGTVLRVSFFVLTPTIYGVPNTLLYIPNSLVGGGFDGWATVLAAAASLAVFVGVALARPPAAPAAARMKAPGEPQPAPAEVPDPA